MEVSVPDLGAAGRAEAGADKRPRGVEEGRGGIQQVGWGRLRVMSKLHPALLFFFLIYLVALGLSCGRRAP